MAAYPAVRSAYIGCMTQPSLFLSHGAPDLALADSSAREFLRDLGGKLERPDAIIIASAHHESAVTSVRSPDHFRTLHDFGNFDPRLFAMRYEPPGAPALADEIRTLLAAAGFDARDDRSPDIDHGAWVPLSLLVPAADVPVVMVSIDPARNADWHEKLGAALAPLRRRNILLVGSGSISHNLSAVFTSGPDAERGWVEDFTAWLEEGVRLNERERLLSAMETAPAAARNHPTDEHLLPFFFALGAGDAEATGVRLHHSYTYGVLAMDAYAFGEPEVIARLAA